MLTVGKFVEAAIKKYSKVSYFKNFLKNLWKQPLQRATPQKLLCKSFSETFIRTAFLCHIFKKISHFLNSLSHFRIYKLIMVSKTCKTFQNLDTVKHRYSVKEILWKISQHLQESCCMSESSKIIL